MAKREVTVTINGEEYVSDATGKADAAMGGFTSKIPGWAKSVALLTAAYAAVSSAIGFAKDYVLDAIGAYDRFSFSQTKLAAQSKLTGVPLAELNRLAQEAASRFSLSTVVANDAATTVAKYASRAGDATKANELLARALDLGAASGLDAAATMEALEMGLRGQDEGFDKLLGKNPSSIWKEYADANGLAVGKMTDTEKRLAEVTALIDAGAMVVGSYGDRVDSGAGAQDRLNNQLDNAKIAFGQAIQPARIFIIQGLSTLVDVGGRVVLALARITNALVVGFTGAVEGARSAVGFLALGIGKLTGNTALEAWGRTQSQAFAQFREQMAKLEAKYLTTGAAATQSATEQTRAAQAVTAAGTKAVEKGTSAIDAYSARVNARLGEPMRVAIGLTEGAITRLGQAATAQLPTVQSEQFLTHMQGLVEASGKARDRIMGISDGTSTAQTRTRDMAREVEQFARGALDASVAFGVIDDSAARALNSAVNIAASIKNLATSGFSFAGVTGVIGGVAALVNTMMAGDAERRRLLRENNTALTRLRSDISAMNVNVTGEQLSRAQTALSGQTFRSGEAAWPAEYIKLTQLLQSQGMTIGDLERIGKELGISLTDSRGSFSFAAVNQLVQALGMVQPGRLGQDLATQLDFFRESQRIEGTTGANAIQGVLDFLRNVGGVSALDGLDASDPQALRNRLREIFTQLNNGQGVQGLGKLTGSQFMDLILGLINDIDGLDGAAPATGGGDVVVPDTGGGGGSVTMPVETIQSVIKAMDTNLGTILTAHTTLHERIAAATESSALSLTSIDAKMDRLIDVTAGVVDRADAGLAARLRLAQLGNAVQ